MLVCVGSFPNDSCNVKLHNLVLYAVIYVIVSFPPSNGIGAEGHKGSSSVDMFIGNYFLNAVGVKNPEFVKIIYSC